MPEKVPEKTPGAWLTKLSMIAPGLRERLLRGVLLLLPVLLPVLLLHVLFVLLVFGLRPTSGHGEALVLLFAVVVVAP